MPYYMDLPGITWVYVSLVQLVHEKDAPARGRVHARPRERQYARREGAPIRWALVAKLGLLEQ
jgi:hypothetical protein